MKAVTLTHARIDAPHLADGLFVITRGAKGRGQNRIVSAKWSDLTITFACVEPLGVLEQTLLLALVALAGIDGKRISRNTKSARSRDLHALLDAKNGAEDRDGVMVSTSVLELIDACDLQNCGSAYGTVRIALTRLERVIVEVRTDDGGKAPSTLLLRTNEESDGKIDVAMNYRIREALVSTGFARIDLTERRLLTTDVARLVHAFLSRWLRIGGDRDIKISSLAKHVWSDGLGDNKSTRRDRRRQIHLALGEIGKTHGWTASVMDREAVRVRRSKASDEKTTHLSTRKPPTSNEKTTHLAGRGRGAKSA